MDRGREPTADHRGTLRDTLPKWRGLLATAARLPDKTAMPPTQREALESSAWDHEQVFWIECLRRLCHLEAAKDWAQLALVDDELWKAFVREAWPNDTEWVDLFESSARLRIGLRIVISDETSDVIESTRTVVDWLYRSHSRKYKQIVRFMEDVAGQPLCSLAVPPVWLDYAVGHEEHHGYFLDEHEDEEDGSNNDTDEEHGGDDEDHAVQEDSEPTRRDQGETHGNDGENTERTVHGNDDNNVFDEHGGDDEDHVVQEDPELTPHDQGETHGNDGENMEQMVRGNDDNDVMVEYRGRVAQQHRGPTLDDPGQRRDNAGEVREQMVNGNDDNSVLVEYRAHPRHRDRPRAIKQAARQEVVLHDNLVTGEEDELFLAANVPDNGVDEGPEEPDNYTMTLLLDTIRNSLSRQPTPADNTVVRVTRLTIEPRSIDMDENALETLTAIRNLGIHVSAIPSVCLLEMEGDARDRQDAFQHLRSLVDVNTQPCKVDPPLYRTRGARCLWRGAVGKGVEHFAVRNLGSRSTYDSMVAELLAPCVFSAIQASGSLRSVVVDFMNRTPWNDDNTRSSERRLQLLRWLTFALFCRPRLDTVDLNAVELSVRDVECMEQMWNASDPLKLLFPDEDGDVGTVTASRIYLREPHHNGLHHYWVEPSTTKLAVLGETRSGYIPVLLPGWGRAWVKQERQVVISGKRNRHGLTFQSPSHLAIRHATSPDALLVLLRLVGRELKYLTVSDTHLSDPERPVSMCEQILNYCPNLVELAMPGLTRFTPVLDTFRKGRCTKLQRISLTDVRVRSEGDAIELFSDLSNHRNAIAKGLRSLQLSIAGDLDRVVLDAALEMLHVNTRLLDVSLHFSGIPNTAIRRVWCPIRMLSVGVGD